MDGIANDARVVVRAARLDELDALRALVERSFRALGGAHYAPSEIDGALEGAAIRVDPGLVADGTYFVAERDGALVGCGGWSAKHATAKGAPLPERRAEVRAMFVDPDHARLGVGRALLAAAESAIARAGFDVAHLLATRSGVAFYQRAGYEAFATHDVTLPDGGSLEVICMRRHLA